MTKTQKVLKALLNAAGQDVPISRLLESAPSVRTCIASLRKAGFVIHTHVGSKKTGPGAYRLEPDAVDLINGVNGTRLLNPTRGLRAEIAQRRKENRDKLLKRGWNPEPLINLRHTELLDWIEAQLEAMDPDPSPLTATAQGPSRRKTALLNDSQREKGQTHAEHDGTGSDPSDAGNGPEDTFYARTAGGTRT